MQIGDNGVGAPENDQAAVNDVFREHGRRIANRCGFARPAGTAADGTYETGRSKPGKETSVQCTALDQSLGSHVAVGENSRWAITGNDLPPTASNRVQRRVPTDALKGTHALGTDSPQWVENTLRAVDAVEIGIDLGTETAARERMLGGADQL